VNQLRKLKLDAKLDALDCSLPFHLCYLEWRSVQGVDFNSSISRSFPCVNSSARIKHYNHLLTVMFLGWQSLVCLGSIANGQTTKLLVTVIIILLDIMNEIWSFMLWFVKLLIILHLWFHLNELQQRYFCSWPQKMEFSSKCPCKQSLRKLLQESGNLLPLDANCRRKLSCPLTS